jgi:protein-disulfide isomerase
MSWLLQTALGLDVQKFKADMKDPQTLANIKADYEAGKAIGVRGTPTIYVNGRQLQELSYAALKALIDEELAR